LSDDATRFDHASLIEAQVTQPISFAKYRHEGSMVSFAKTRSEGETAMSILKSALLATALVFTVTAANAFSDEDLRTGYHGNTPTVQSYSPAPRPAISGEARGSFAQAGAVHQPAVATMNPLLDMFHGLTVR
jgi:hypothetical protein